MVAPQSDWFSLLNANTNKGTGWTKDTDKVYTELQTCTSLTSIGEIIANVIISTNSDVDYHALIFMITNYEYCCMISGDIFSATPITKEHIISASKEFAQEAFCVKQAVSCKFPSVQDLLDGDDNSSFGDASNLQLDYAPFSNQLRASR